jgi:uncharacterized protein
LFCVAEIMSDLDKNPIQPVNNSETDVNTSGNLLDSIQMFMSDAQKAKIYHSNREDAYQRNKSELQSNALPNENIAKSVSITNPTNNNPKDLFAKPNNAPLNVAPSSMNVATPNAKDANFERDRRSKGQAATRSIGRVICCNGANIIISSTADQESVEDQSSWSIGQVISIATPFGRVVSMITEMKTEKGMWREEEVNNLILHADIMGEVSDGKHGLQFKRGVTKFPQVGSIAHRIRFKDLECIYDLGSRKSVEIGNLSQNEEIAAIVGVDDILGRHMAILGTTGVGKSCAVGLIVTRAIEADDNLRVIMLDPHNEFAAAFGDKANNLNQNNLDLPYWLLNFEELIDVIYRSKIIEEETDILQELVVAAKIERQAQIEAAGSIIGKYNGVVVVDTPIPYRMGDVIKLIDESLGQLEPKYNRTRLKAIRVRLESLENNPRYDFMFSRGGREEDFSKIISNLFRLPSYGKPMSTINLSGLPSEVVNCVAAVVARLAFDVARASNGAMRVLLVCEEAHRYVPKEREQGFMPTRMAISRIAKEGRKYNCSVAIITQRPGELDPTILSQCSTVFAMRLTNEMDQDIIRAAISDSSGSIIGFMSSLDNREAIAFGEGVAVPMRLRFADYDLAKLRANYKEANPMPMVENLDKIDPQFFVDSLRGGYSASKSIAQKAISSTNNRPLENPIRPGLTRPSLLKKDVSEILARFGNEEGQAKPVSQEMRTRLNVPNPNPAPPTSGIKLRKEIW